MLTVNGTLNRIHEWSEPARHPMARFFLARLGCIACTAIEAVAAAFAILECTKHAAEGLKRAIKALLIVNHQALENQAHRRIGCHTIIADLLEICKLIVGIASTVFIGIVFSPEINFRIHLKLGIAVDNLAVKKEKQLKAQIDTKIKAAKIAQERAERFAKFQAQRQTAKDASEQEYAVDCRLAELLGIAFRTK
jgi:hypothetical protein